MHNYDQWDFGTGWIHFGSHTGFQIQVLDLDWHSQMLLQHCFLCFLVKVLNSFVKRNFELHHNMGFWAISTDVVGLHLVAVVELMMKLGWKNNGIKHLIHNLVIFKWYTLYYLPLRTWNGCSLAIGEGHGNSSHGISRGAIRKQTWIISATNSGL